MLNLQAQASKYKYKNITMHTVAIGAFRAQGIVKRIENSTRTHLSCLQCKLVYTRVSGMWKRCEKAHTLHTIPMAAVPHCSDGDSHLGQSCKISHERVVLVRVCASD